MQNYITLITGNKEMNRTHGNDNVVDVRNLQMIQLRVTWRKPCNNYSDISFYWVEDLVNPGKIHFQVL